MTFLYLAFELFRWKKHNYKLHDYDDTLKMLTPEHTIKKDFPYTLSHNTMWNTKPKISEMWTPDVNILSHTQVVHISDFYRS